MTSAEKREREFYVLPEAASKGKSLATVKAKKEMSQRHTRNRIVKKRKLRTASICEYNVRYITDVNVRRHTHTHTQDWYVTAVFP